jgi:translation initiation factor 1
MKKNLFEMGAQFEDTWSSDNRTKPAKHPSANPLSPHDHRLRLHKEKRRTKTVTIVQPFQLESLELKTLLKTLKKQLGTGGTLKGNTLEFQGDIEEALRNQLQKRGFGFKGALK